MNTLSRIVASIVIIIVLYVCGVFLFPRFFDTYGVSSWNMVLRSWKMKIESINMPPSEVSWRERFYESGVEWLSGSRDRIESRIQDGKNVLEQGGHILEAGGRVIDDTKEVLQKTASGIDTAVNDLSEKLDDIHRMKDIFFATGTER